MSDPIIASKSFSSPEVDYGNNPFQPNTSREFALEEAARDFDKDPKQLLADIHHESFQPYNNYLARTIARMASMQLRVQQEVEKQSISSALLNETIARLTWIILGLTVLSTIFAFLSLVLSFLSYCRG
jgi:hypothetical protein